MWKFLKTPIVLLASAGALVAAAQSPTPLPVTGNVSAITGGAVPYAAALVELENCASPVSITGYSVIVQQQYQIQANGSGVINSAVWPNDLITCNGTTGNSQYMLSYIVNGVPSGTPQCYQVTSTQGAWNLNTQQPISCSTSPPNPQDAQYRNLNVTGCFSLNGGNCDGTPEQLGTLYYVDGFPTNCTVNSVAYQSKLDCALATASAAVAASCNLSTGQMPGFTPSLIFGTAIYPTYTGVTLPTNACDASINLIGQSAHAAEVNTTGSPLQPSTIIRQMTQINNAVVYQPPNVFGNYPSITIQGLAIDANFLAPEGFALWGCAKCHVSEISVDNVGVIPGQNYAYDEISFTDPNGNTDGNGGYGGTAWVYQAQVSDIFAANIGQGGTAKLQASTSAGAITAVTSVNQPINAVYVTTNTLGTTVEFDTPADPSSQIKVGSTYPLYGFGTSGTCSVAPTPPATCGSIFNVFSVTVTSVNSACTGSHCFTGTLYGFFQVTQTITGISGAFAGTAGGAYYAGGKTYTTANSTVYNASVVVTGSGPYTMAVPYSAASGTTPALGMFWNTAPFVGMQLNSFCASGCSGIQNAVWTVSAYTGGIPGSMTATTSTSVTPGTYTGVVFAKLPTVLFTGYNPTNQIAMTVNPTVNDTLTINGTITNGVVTGGTAVTFVASGASGNQVNIGGTAAITQASLYSLLSGSADSNISKNYYSITGGVIVASSNTNSLLIPTAFASNVVSIQVTSSALTPCSPLNPPTATVTMNQQALVSVAVTNASTNCGVNNPINVQANEVDPVQVGIWEQYVSDSSFYDEQVQSANSIAALKTGGGSNTHDHVHTFSPQIGIIAGSGDTWKGIEVDTPLQYGIDVRGGANQFLGTNLYFGSWRSPGASAFLLEAGATSTNIDGSSCTTPQFAGDFHFIVAPTGPWETGNALPFSTSSIANVASCDYSGTIKNMNAGNPAQIMGMATNFEANPGLTSISSHSFTWNIDDAGTQRAFQCLGFVPSADNQAIFQCYTPYFTAIAPTSQGFGFYNPNQATSSLNVAPPYILFSGNYWTGTASANAVWGTYCTYATGSNPAFTCAPKYNGPGTPTWDFSNTPWAVKVLGADLQIVDPSASGFTINQTTATLSGSSKTATWLNFTGTVGIIPTQSSGHAICETTSHTLGHCSTVVASDGTCTCS